MKRSTQIGLGALLLLALAALSSVKRGAALHKSDGARDACCPLVQSLNDMSLTTSTNSHPATNHP